MMVKSGEEIIQSDLKNKLKYLNVLWSILCCPRRQAQEFRSFSGASHIGFPGSTAGKEPAYQYRRPER